MEIIILDENMKTLLIMYALDVSIRQSSKCVDLYWWEMSIKRFVFVLGICETLRDIEQKLNILSKILFDDKMTISPSSIWIYFATFMSV